MPKRISWPFDSMAVNETRVFPPHRAKGAVVAARAYARKHGCRMHVIHRITGEGTITEVTRLTENVQSTGQRTRWPFADMAVGQTVELVDVAIPKAKNALGVLKHSTGKKFSVSTKSRPDGAVVMTVTRLADGVAPKEAPTRRSWPFVRMQEGEHVIIPENDAKAALNALAQVKISKRWEFRHAMTDAGLLVQRRKNKDPEAAPTANRKPRTPGQANKWPFATMNIGETVTFQLESVKHRKLISIAVTTASTRKHRKFQWQEGGGTVSVTRLPDPAPIQKEWAL